MAKWKIWYNVGFGREEQVIEADSEDEALEAAYEDFSQACENQYDYGAEELSEEAGAVEDEDEETEHGRL